MSDTREVWLPVPGYEGHAAALNMQLGFDI